MRSLIRLSSTAVVSLVLMLTGFACIAGFTIFGLLHFKREVDILIFVTVVGFSITIFQLGQTFKAQEAKFLSDYLSKLYTDKELSSAFHDLVESYNNAKFRELNELAIRSSAKEKRIQTREPIFDPFETAQGYRAGCIGSRFYHPDCFQGSEEERRLDSLLGYLDIVGYHFYHGVIPLRDLAAMLNYQLATLNGRDVIRHYFGVSASEDWFATTDIQKQSGSVQVPFLYLRHMMVAYRDYNEANAQQLKFDQKRISDELRRKKYM